MKRRAELEELTRRRITESAVGLHEEVGPARTSIAAIAERAGVRRTHAAGRRSRIRRGERRARFATCTPSTDAPRKMYSSLLRDEPLLPAVHRRLRDFHRYLDTRSRAS
jgi:hypothetical protein